MKSDPATFLAFLPNFNPSSFLSDNRKNLNNYSDVLFSL